MKLNLFPQNLDYLKHLLYEPISKSLSCKTRVGNLFGIEIENELTSKTLTPDFVQHLKNFKWRQEADGSLRGVGYEFISPPSTKEMLLLFFKDLKPKLKGLRWSFSRRTSSHIHVNVADMTYHQLCKFVCLYWMTEGLLFESVTNVRKDNTFCISKSLESKEILKNMLSSPMLGDDVGEEDNQKYASLNFHPLRRFGTVECRIFHSTFGADMFDFWLSHLEDLKNFAMKKGTLTELKQLFIDLSPASFAKAIFSKSVFTRHVINCEKDNFDLEESLRRGFDFARSILNYGEVFKGLEDTFQEIEKKASEMKQKNKIYVEENAINDDWLDELFA